MKINWILWIILIVLVMIIFPKPCGTKIPSKILRYNCLGFESPIISQFQKPEYREDWCSGICISKEINPDNYLNNISNDYEEIPPIAGVSSNLVRVVPLLIAILGVILFISFINSIKRDGGGKITVIKGPGQ
jgi:hypothetical protein